MSQDFSPAKGAVASRNWQEPKRRSVLAWPLAALGLGGCALNAGDDHRGADAPIAAPLARPVKVAWVLSSGGPRGFTHVGALKALAAMGLAPDLIVGASVGALVGSLYASGLSATTIEQLALDLKPWSMARWAIGTPERYSGGPLASVVQDNAKERLLERMPIAMACVATRQSDGQTIAFTRGDAGLAVQASAAIPGQFSPVRIRGQNYMDADGHAPLPVRLARTLGAQTVLAIDASAHADRAPEGAARFRESDLKKQALVAADAVHADCVIKPDFGYWVSFTRDFRERAIAAGFRDTMAQSDRLKALHRGATNAP